MGREVKRVPVDFDWPQGKIWPGYKYLTPDCEIPDCGDAEGSEVREWCVESLCPFHRAQWDDVIPYVKIDPPSGDGWQLWETVSEGSPITPVFPTAEALAQHMVTARPWRYKGDYDSALRFINVGWAPSMVLSPGKGVQSGAEWVGEQP